MHLSIGMFQTSVCYGSHTLDYIDFIMAIYSNALIRKVQSDGT